MMSDERSAPPKDDFETERAEKVSRRGFNKVLTLGSLAAAAGAVGALTDGCSKTYPTIVVAHAGDISVGESKIFSYPSDVNPCLLLRPAENTYFAVQPDLHTHFVPGVLPAGGKSDHLPLPWRRLFGG
jgi:hypothetical protein